MGKYSRGKIILAIFAGLFLLGQLFVVPKTYVNNKIVSAIQAPFVFWDALSTKTDLIDQINILEKENRGLRAQILAFGSRPEILKQSQRRYLRAQIYSTYPLNNANTFLINAGINQGLKTGAEVMSSIGIFLGRIKEVEKNTAIVETIFESGWDLPVRIGENKTDALLVGSDTPRVTLISKSGQAKKDDPVYLASEEFEFGLYLGKLGEVEAAEQDVFESAILEVPYNRLDLNQVFVSLD